MCTITYYQDARAVIPDGNGGAIIVWDDVRPSGWNTVEWNATDRFGNELGSGVYLHALHVRNKVITRKMTILK